MTKKSDDKKPDTQEKSLTPWNIDLEKITDKEERKQAEEAINKCVNELKQDIAVLLSKNNITIFELAFVHPGSQIPILLTKGPNYTLARLGVYAAKALKTQIDEELTV
jgi:hypothetical protein